MFFLQKRVGTYKCLALISSSPPHSSAVCRSLLYRCLFSSLLTNCNNAIMPPKNKKKDANASEDKFMRAARFGRVKNDLKMVCRYLCSLLCTCCFFSCSIINFNAPISCLTSGLRRSPKCWKINPY